MKTNLLLLIFCLVVAIVLAYPRNQGALLHEDFSSVGVLYSGLEHGAVNQGTDSILLDKISLANSGENTEILLSSSASAIRPCPLDVAAPESNASAALAPAAGTTIRAVDWAEKFSAYELAAFPQSGSEGVVALDNQGLRVLNTSDLSQVSESHFIRPSARSEVNLIHTGLTLPSGEMGIVVSGESNLPGVDPLPALALYRAGADRALRAPEIITLPESAPVSITHGDLFQAGKLLIAYLSAEKSNSISDSAKDNIFILDPSSGLSTVFSTKLPGAASILAADTDQNGQAELYAATIELSSGAAKLYRFKFAQRQAEVAEAESLSLPYSLEKIHLAVADLNGDSRAELVVGLQHKPAATAQATASLRPRYLTVSADGPLTITHTDENPDPASNGVVNLAVTDLNLDGKDELIMLAAPASEGSPAVEIVGDATAEQLVISAGGICPKPPTATPTPIFTPVLTPPVPTSTPGNPTPPYGGGGVSAPDIQIDDGAALNSPDQIPAPVAKGSSSKVKKSKKAKSKAKKPKKTKSKAMPQTKKVKKAAKNSKKK